MRRIVCAALALAIVGAPAVAADASRWGTGAFVPAPGAYNWSGAYFGLNLGYQWGSTSNLGTDPSGFAGGLQGGYNWQTGQFVFGVEADIQASGADDTFAAYKFSNPWFGTLRGRGGVAINNVLLYLTAGVAYGGTEMTFAGLRESNTHLGWTAGAGIEVGLAPNWSARAEALYVDLNDQNYALTGFNHGLGSGLLRFGVNYRF